MTIKVLCREWLKDNFNIDARIRSVEVMNQDLVDRLLGILRVKFEFTGDGEVEGDGVAFFDVHKLPREGINELPFEVKEYCQEGIKPWV